jgi:hypothetical protein
MGSQETLDPAPTRPPATDQEQHRDPQRDRAELLAHLQYPAAWGGHEFGDWPEDHIANGLGGDLHARHRHDHTRLAHEFDHTHPDLERDPVRDAEHAEHAFDQLNPDYGIPADTHNPYGHQALRDREAALTLGTRVAVASSRENDPNPVMWLAGQDYRAADAIHTARVQAIRQRHGPERLSPER